MKAELAVQLQVDLDAFVESEYPKVVAAVGFITGQPQEAPDAVQDAILGYLARPPKRKIDNLAAWITVVASNRVRDAQRARTYEQKAFASLGTEDVSVEAGLSGLDIDVVEAIRALPLQQKQACILRYLLDQTVESIAEGLGVSEGTVKTQLHRARKSLAARLRREDHHD